MKPDQKAIYYTTGEREEHLRDSPLIEMYNDRDVEVLIMDDEMDEVIIPSIGRYKDIELKSVNRSDAAEELKTDEDKREESEIEPLIKKIKDVLKDRVKDVKASTRLSDSPSCIVADEKDPTVKMQGLLKAMGQAQFATIKPILEINPKHAIVKKLQDIKDNAVVEDISNLLFEQAMLIEGVELQSPPVFVKRLNRIIEKAVMSD
jgi:molecular chaperone HtpG